MSAGRFSRNWKAIAAVVAAIGGGVVAVLNGLGYVDTARDAWAEGEKYWAVRLFWAVVQWEGLTLLLAATCIVLLVWLFIQIGIEARTDQESKASLEESWPTSEVLEAQLARGRVALGPANRSLAGAVSVSGTGHVTPPLSEGTVRLQWKKSIRDLHVDVTNMTSDAILDFHLFIHDVRWYFEEQRQFVQTDQLHTVGSFPEIELHGGNQHLYPGTNVTVGCVMNESGRLSVYGAKKDDPTHRRSTTRHGIYRVSFRYHANSKSRVDHLLFRWLPDTSPEPYMFPIPITKAPPPITPVRGN